MYLFLEWCSYSFGSRFLCSSFRHDSTLYEEYIMLMMDMNSETCDCLTVSLRLLAICHSWHITLQMGVPSWKNAWFPRTIDMQLNEWILYYLGYTHCLLTKLVQLWCVLCIEINFSQPNTTHLNQPLDHRWTGWKGFLFI